ncbi:MAG: NUMOD3 domain-containing DNA-binding protein [Candidatus Bathyarchaeota archaeon]
MISKTCERCNRAFDVRYPSEEKRRFCSKSCQLEDLHIHTKGRNHPFYGRHHTEESKALISRHRRGIRASPSTEFKKGSVPTNKTDVWISCNSCKKPFRIPPCRLKISKHHYCSYTCKYASQRGVKQDREYVSYRMKKTFEALQKRPTLLEKRAIKLINHLNLPLKYNGNTAELIVGGKIPDFYNRNGEKTVLEIFGRVYHDPLQSFRNVPYHQTEKGCVEHYARYGFRCIVVWDDELTEETLKSKSIFG